MESQEKADAAPSALRCYAVQMMDGLDVSELASQQKAKLEAEENIRIEIEKTLRPVLRMCSSSADVLAVKRELRNKMQCNLEGLIEVNFAVAYVGLESA